MDELNIRPDGGERLVYSSPDYPVRSVDGDVSRFFRCAAGCHWHNDFEVLIAVDGTMEYFVNGRIVTILPGQAIFVNSNRLHYGFSSKQQPCFYICLVFHMDLFGTPGMPTYRAVQQLTRDDCPDYLLLTDREDLQHIRQVYTLYREKPEGYELSALSALSALMAGIVSRMPRERREETDPGWISLRQMVGYLQLHYGRPIRLEEIAAAGAVCRSKCCRLFREKLDTTPLGYLNRYRLEKARELLMTTDESITVIAGSCGFDSSSYFAEMFRKVYGESPRDVRNAQRKAQ